MSLKLVLLVVVAFVSVQQATARYHLSGFDDEVNVGLSTAPLKDVGEVDMWPLRVARSLFHLPLAVVVGLVRALLLPVRIFNRVVFWPVRLAYKVAHFLLWPVYRAFRGVVSALLNFLMAVPVVRVPVNVLYYVHHFLTMPFRMMYRFAHAFLL